MPFVRGLAIVLGPPVLRGVEFTRGPLSLVVVSTVPFVRGFAIVLGPPVLGVVSVLPPPVLRGVAAALGPPVFVAASDLPPFLGLTEATSLRFPAPTVLMFRVLSNS